MKRCCEERGAAIKLILDVAKVFNDCDIETLSPLEKETLSLLLNVGVGEIVDSQLKPKYYKIN